MTKTLTTHHEFEPIYEEIRSILDEARAKAWRAVNTSMVLAYWNVGRVIVENEQKGRSRAEYGKQLIEMLSKRLTGVFGRGFDRSNIWNMKGFYINYPILEALRRELSWTHYRLLLKVDRYTLPEGQQQIFASKYKLYLPTEEELIREIEESKEIIEREKRLDQCEPE